MSQLPNSENNAMRNNNSSRTPNLSILGGLGRRDFLKYSMGSVAAVSTGMMALGCGGSDAPVLPNILATDYSVAAHWLAMPTAISKPVDVFYLYPTAWQKVNSTDPNICEIDNPSMLAGSNAAFARQATAFETIGNIFAPYYRQADIFYILGLAPTEREKVMATEPSVDALAAFDYYIKNANNGRPFILAGHSQGSNVLLNLLSDYMVKNPDVYKRMVAAYVIGYSVTDEYLAKNTHLKFAQSADDTGVIISYNTQSPDVLAGQNPVVLPGARVINPITWTATEPLADKSLGLGSFMPVSATAFAQVPQYADAQVNTAKGALITTADATGLVLGLGPGIYHSYDYLFYYFNLRENAGNRISKYQSYLR